MHCLMVLEDNFATSGITNLVVNYLGQVGNLGLTREFLPVKHKIKWCKDENAHVYD